jgi:hypothetical protein
MKTTVPTGEAAVAHTVGTNPDAVSFLARFDEDTVLVGYPKAHLWVEARGADDMDLFVLVQKLDAHGTPLRAFTVPNRGALVHDLTDHGASILRYQGPDGRLRVSARHLDEKLSTDDVPAHSFDRVELLAPGEIVDVEIDLLPIGLSFRAGEQLRFVVSSRNLLGTLMPGIQEYAGANRGEHVLHTGGEHASYLQLPVQAGRRATAAWVRLAGAPDDSTIARFEVRAARRALALLKAKLGRERLLELLADEITAGEAYLRDQVARSAGEELTGTTTLHAHGITAAQFTGWLSQAFGREDVLLAGHPEHYSIHAAGGRVDIVETLGDHVCSFSMREWDEATAPAAPTGRRSRLVLGDGTVVGGITSSFTDVEGGFTASLSVTLPASCGPAVVEHHLEHFAVEFHTWILRAASESSAR